MGCLGDQGLLARVGLVLGLLGCAVRFSQHMSDSIGSEAVISPFRRLAEACICFCSLTLGVLRRFRADDWPQRAPAGLSWEDQLEATVYRDFRPPSEIVLVRGLLVHGRVDER